MAEKDEILSEIIIRRGEHFLPKCALIKIKKQHGLQPIFFNYKK
jgi:hypothetical protein